MKLGNAALKWKLTVPAKSLVIAKTTCTLVSIFLKYLIDMKNVALTKSIESSNKNIKLEQVKRSE